MTLRFAADENIDNDILRGLLRREPNFDMIRIQDTSAYQQDDLEVLNWVSNENRILITHDAKTMPKYAYERLQSGESFPGVIIINDSLSIGDVIEELLTIDGASEADEWINKVIHLPYLR